MKTVARALWTLQVDEQVQDRGLNRDIERRCRFVADDEPWPAREGAGDRDPLLLAPRKIRAETAHSVPGASPLESARACGSSALLPVELAD